MRQIFILVPSMHPTGPVKGAVALANALADLRPVTLAALKNGPGASTPVDPRVRLMSLAGWKRWRDKVAAYRRELSRAGGRAGAASISFCLSADVANLACRREAVVCSSVRGNLPYNYRMDYGPPGLMIAAAHLFMLRWFDRSVAMTRSMADQVARFSGSHPCVIGNFIDEAVLEQYRHHGPRHGAYRFIFVGSLSARKRPHLLLQAAVELKRMGMEFCIDLVGEGALRAGLERLRRELDVEDVVRLHGHLAEPYPLLASADCMVLPSLSEGVSRAVLEALYLGVPCLVRDVDGGNEVITSGKNGLLFHDDRLLARSMAEIAAWSRRAVSAADNLLPAAYRQRDGAQRYLTLVED
jgi:glycosyltransferase involved in cell wall biosynthesis